jgi:hypothetical protein
MSNLPLRKLGEVGVIPDANPYDLPPNAFSDCSNVIFDEGVVLRAPVFKQLFPAIRSSIAINDMVGTINASTVNYDSAEGAPVDDVRFVSSYADPVAGETLFICDQSGEVRGYPNGNLQFLHPGSGLVSNENPWTHAQVSGLSFMARKGMVPYVRAIRDQNNFSPLVGDWPSTDSCAVMRSYNDFAIALNVTKGTSQYPTMVKWSNPIAYGDTPADVLWDASNPNFISGENVLGEMTSAIRDGLALGSQFILYSKEQVWQMEYTGSTFVFNFRKLFPTGGIVNTNCVVEVDGKHFVFGEDDLYVHDGISKQSIADGRCRRYVFKSLDRAKLNACFVQHDPVSNLIIFAYPSKQPGMAYAGTQFCNRAAIYNYRTDTWSFMDLPNCVGGASVNLVLAANLYLENGPDIPDLYDTSATSSQGQAPRLSVMLSAPHVPAGVTESRVFAFDLPTANVVRLPAHPETLKDAWVQREGIDLDDPGLALKLRSYKFINNIVPQMDYEDGVNTIRWRVGAFDKPKDPTVWYSDQEYSPLVDYKLDMRVGGRYLSYRVDIKGIEPFRFGGFDAEVVALSHR